MPKRILVVDDEPNILIPIQFLMQQNGYDVTVVSNGKDALEAMERCRADLILLDIMMPMLDGFEVCQKIREKPEWQDVKIVLVTAMGREANIEKGLSLGADAYVLKPFSNAEIVDKVNKLLEAGE
jgi:two-component system alkaline phosphatase synthesis response regulator PhoP